MVSRRAVSFTVTTTIIVICRCTSFAESICCAPVCERPIKMPVTAARSKCNAWWDKSRRRWPHVQIPLRADSSFYRKELMAWCKQHLVDYVFGSAPHRSPGPYHRPPDATSSATASTQRTPGADVCRVLLPHPARAGAAPDGWWARPSIWRKGENPRFVVSSLDPRAWPAQPLYEQLYWARGDLENRSVSVPRWAKPCSAASAQLPLMPVLVRNAGEARSQKISQ
jgi:hypothetical protein